MPSQPPIPPLLDPNLSNLPYSSLTLLTSTLGATTNWLVLRFICAALKGKGYGAGHDTHTIRGHSRDQRVVLVSLLRDGHGWKESGRKLGIDFQKVHLVDGLGSGLGLGAGGIVEVEKAIASAIGSCKETLDDGGNVILVLDGLDFLLAAMGCEVLEILDMIGELREVYSTLITTAADFPLSQLPTTPLEISHTAFLMSLAHQARSIMSLMGLNTGVARDVSGLLRISKGAGESADEGDVERTECLYYIGPDGGVKVSERCDLCSDVERRLTKERTQYFSVEFKVLEVYALRALINASTRRITRKFALGSKVSSLATGRLVPGDEENAGLTAFVDPIPVRALLGLRDRIMKVCIELNPKTELLHEIVVPEAWCGTGVRNKVALAEKALIAMFLISITECWLPHRDYADKICGGTRTSHISKAGFFEHELRFDNVRGKSEMSSCQSDRCN
ncbi:MAG: hypothetical protein ASARMPREDX12_002908 [Alectoria sarmentosa]|nr:MAG: hypothetical protein ASARMPREDX12_002908 [Alectoria sarmentosa]